MMRRARRMEKEKFRFVRINTKSDTGKPLATEKGKSLELCNNTGKGLTGHKNTAIVDIKRKVGVSRTPKAKLEER